MIVAVGSTNPTKIAPVRTVFSRHFSDVEVREAGVSSGVSEQPMTDGETYTGALNRARRALAAVPGAQFGVGIEGGLEERPYGWFEHSLVVIVDRQERIGVGASGGLVLPDPIIAAVRQGKTLEEAIDESFGTTRIGEGIGMFGLMTKGVVTRTSGVEHGVAFALARFLHEQLYG